MHSNDTLTGIVAQLEKAHGDTMVFITGDTLVGLTAEQALASGAKLLLETDGSGAILVVGYRR